ncbi:MAG: HAMP domain-containing sensor histidine kinase [Prevotella sp.]|nr:HAMP domain-containing sensor histidine kinase [Prevotella sp.]
MMWTDKIRQVKIILVVTAIIIAVASLVISHILIKDLSNEEHNKMVTWAQALNTLNNATENTDLTLVLNVIKSNNTIPVIVMSSKGEICDYRNIDINENNANDSIKALKKYAQSYYHSGKYIKIDLDGTTDYQLVCYDESIMLKRLATYPYVQLGIVLIFVVIAIFALLSSKKAEQNKVWVGLSKETAHQLGTPISSLLAWTEILKESYPEDEMIREMEKDVKRLEIIAERFSKIGSIPEPKETCLNEVITHVVEYMDRRTSSKVKITSNCGNTNIIVRINISLFEWVIENLCKNAVDAMEGKGNIDIYTYKEKEKTIIEVKDNGKGIKRSDIKNVFTPGFTTKKRGWGLGLSLAKRIIEEYHKGKIYVKDSEIGKGTTFRIELST